MSLDKRRFESVNAHKTMIEVLKASIFYTIADPNYSFCTQPQVIPGCGLRTLRAGSYGLRSYAMRTRFAQTLMAFDGLQTCSLIGSPLIRPHPGITCGCSVGSCVVVWYSTYVQNIQPRVRNVTVNAARILCYSDPSFGVTEDNPLEEESLPFQKVL